MKRLVLVLQNQILLQNKMKRNTLSTIVICLFPMMFMNYSLDAQDKEDNCAINLRLAQSRFEAGQIEGIPDLITGCIKSGFSKEDKITAYKLLINTYVFDGNIEKAEEVMFDFLIAYPEYEILATDPNEFSELMNQFDNKPRYSVGVIGGGNISLVRILENIATYQTTNNVGNYNPSGLGFQAGFIFGKNIGDNFEVNAEILYKSVKYSFIGTPVSFSSFEFKESQTYVQLPLSVTYSVLPGMLSPYARLGFLSGYMLSSDASVVKSYDDGTALPLSGEKIDLIDKRNLLNFWLIIGGGVKLKITKGYLRADIRYNLGLNNQVSNKSWNDPQSDLEWKYGYRNDKNIRDDIIFNFGYVRTIYHPRKK